MMFGTDDKQMNNENEERDAALDQLEKLKKENVPVKLVAQT